MPHYERRLPHWDTIDQPLFVTFRLHGSLPANRVFPPRSLANSGKAFAAMDRLLDRASNGPLYLSQPEIAGIVTEAIKTGANKLQRYQLHAFVVMPNHVHLLVTPRVLAKQWLAALKGFTAHQANRQLGRQGQRFWQDESYDHLVRSGAEFNRVRAYIEENAVSAGLVAEPRQYPWSSAAGQ